MSSEVRDEPHAVLKCTQTRALMVDPTVAADGFTYERAFIEKWLADGHDTSPQSGAPLAHRLLAPNNAVRQLIAEWRAGRSVRLEPSRVVFDRTQAAEVALGRGTGSVIYAGTLDGTTPVAVKAYTTGGDAPFAREVYDSEMEPHKV